MLLQTIITWQTEKLQCIADSVNTSLHLDIHWQKVNMQLHSGNKYCFLRNIVAECKSNVALRENKGRV